MSEQALERVKTKLQRLHAELPEDEQDVLEAIVGSAIWAKHQAPEVAGFSMDSIGRLIAVTQMKVDSANEDALRGAEQQREQVRNKMTRIQSFPGWLADL